MLFRSDASQDAYGACTYLRRAFTDDTVECSLIAGKGRLSPVKLLSIEEVFFSDQTKKSDHLCDAIREQCKN